MQQSPAMAAHVLAQQAVCGDFRVRLTDRLGTALEHTQIGDKIYVAGKEGEVFKIIASCTAPSSYARCPEDNITALVFVDGVSLGYSYHLTANASASFADMQTSTGRRELVFAAPSLVEMYDAADSKKHAQLNERTEIGTIKVQFWHTTKKTGESTSAQISSSNKDLAYDTKKFFEKPNLGVSAGAIVGPAFTSFTSSIFNRKFNEIKIHLQTKLVVGLLRNAHLAAQRAPDEEEDEEEEEELEEEEEEEEDEDEVLEVDRPEGVSPS